MAEETEPKLTLSEEITDQMWQSGTWGCETAWDIEVIGLGFLKRLIQCVEDGMPPRQWVNGRLQAEFYDQAKQLVEAAEEKGWI